MLQKTPELPERKITARVCSCHPVKRSINEKIRLML